MAEDTRHQIFGFPSNLSRTRFGAAWEDFGLAAARDVGFLEAMLEPDLKPGDIRCGHAGIAGLEA